MSDLEKIELCKRLYELDENTIEDGYVKSVYDDEYNNVRYDVYVYTYFNENGIVAHTNFTPEVKFEISYEDLKDETKADEFSYAVMEEWESCFGI